MDSAPAGRLRSPCLAPRPPFLMIDRIGHVDRKARSLVALRDLTFDDPFLTRQRRGPPLYPAVLLVEMIGQAILSLLNVFPQPRWRTAPPAGLLTRIGRAEFLAAAAPRAELVAEARLIDVDEFHLRGAGRVHIGSTLLALASLEIVNAAA